MSDSERPPRSAARRSPLGLMVLWQLVAEPMHVYRMQKLLRAAGQGPGRQRARPRQPVPDARATDAARPGRGARDGAPRGLPRPHHLRHHRVRSRGRAGVAARDARRRPTRRVPRVHRRTCRSCSASRRTTPALSSSCEPSGSRPSSPRREAQLADNPQVPRLFLLEEEYRRAVLRAELAWLRDVIADLQAGRLTWSEEWLKEIFDAFHPHDEGGSLMTAMIEAHALKKGYRKTSALDGLDLVAEPGQVTAVLGPNGAGKTTFVRAVATLLRLDAGTLRVAGHDVRREPGGRSASDRAGRAVRGDRVCDERAREPRDGRAPVRPEPADGTRERRRRARADRAQRSRRPAGSHLFGRHAPPPRPRRESRRCAAPAAARRADDGPRSAQPQRALGRDPRARRDRARTSC